MEHSGLHVFAYGSNMLTARLLERTPSAAPFATGFVDGYGLRWHKAGLDGSGKANLAPAQDPDARVWGVVYTLDPADRPALDRAESLGVGYEHSDVRVRMEDGDETVALTYTALNTAIDDRLLPFCWYRELVVRGAKEHGLPDPWIATLQAQPCQPDPDGERRARYARLLAGPGTAR